MPACQRAREIDQSQSVFHFSSNGCLYVRLRATNEHGDPHILWSQSKCLLLITQKNV